MATHHFPSLDARCPACGAEGSLYRGFQGRITCSTEECPDAGAVHNLLNDPHLMDHLVKVIEQDGTVPGWTIRHPLVERIHDRLFQCHYGMELAMQRQANLDLGPGVYVVERTPRGRRWHLTPVEATADV
jgi:hypothetical protein